MYIAGFQKISTQYIELHDHFVLYYQWCILFVLYIMNFFWSIMLIKVGIDKCGKNNGSFEAEWEEELYEPTLTAAAKDNAIKAAQELKEKKIE